MSMLLLLRAGLRPPFRRRGGNSGFIVDFYRPALRLVLELGGAPHGHREQASYDAARTAWLVARGYRVRGVRNRELSRGRLERLLGALLQQERSSP